MTRIFCILLLISATSPLVANDSSSPFTKSWTHVNGNSATLELLLCNGDQVTFLRPDGKSWTMPINQLIEEDREIAVAMAQQRGSGFYVSSHLQDEELQAIRDRFAAMKNENADLYNRLTNLAEFPVEEYQIDVNEEGTYFLQFFLKPGVSADATIADDVAQYLNPDPLNEVDFKLSQVAQAAEVVEVADAAEESETSDEPMDSPSDLNSTVVENTAPQEAEKSVIDKITPPSPDDEMSDKAVSNSAPLSDMTLSNPVTVTAGCSNCCNSCSSVVYHASPMCCAPVCTVPTCCSVPVYVSPMSCCSSSCYQTMTTCSGCNNCQNACNPCGSNCTSAVVYGGSCCNSCQTSSGCCGSNNYCGSNCGYGNCGYNSHCGSNDCCGDNSCYRPRRLGFFQRLFRRWSYGYGGCGYGYGY